MPLNELLSHVELLCESAGNEILKVFGGVLNVTEKSDQSPVTAADLAAHRILADGLPKLLDVPLLSEEGALPNFEQRSEWSRYWLIDPLDGTRQFIRGSKDFSVNVALIQDHQSVLGYVYLPAHNIAYRGVKENGAQHRVRGQKWQSIRSSRAGSPLRICVSTTRAGARQQRLIDRLQPATIDLKGSSWKSCVVAEGAADLYPRFGPTCEWDTAAAQCIVEEAGGFMTDINLKPLVYNRRKSLINPDFIVFGDSATASRLKSMLADIA